MNSDRGVELDPRDVADCGRLDAEPGRELAVRQFSAGVTKWAINELPTHNASPLCGLIFEGTESATAGATLGIDAETFARAVASSMT